MEQSDGCCAGLIGCFWRVAHSAERRRFLASLSHLSRKQARGFTGARRKNESTYNTTEETVQPFEPSALPQPRLSSRLSPPPASPRLTLDTASAPPPRTPSTPSSRRLLDCQRRLDEKSSLRRVRVGLFGAIRLRWVLGGLRRPRRSVSALLLILLARDSTHLPSKAPSPHPFHPLSLPPFLARSQPPLRSTAPANQAD
ncbi:hypothetical protein AAT19DRAFT_13538 [Rhodotorula toruloides]|uniref:Uncharacterized protein n=1 Tax=Rhodotorula toruloides TaxID=5286 RepID=A0A2T0ABU1_RHOTO|nr:hypothetical protein AAT19DRAFT_13538 [Rhodotorula toruloides]